MEVLMGAHELIPCQACRVLMINDDSPGVSLITDYYSKAMNIAHLGLSLSLGMCST